MGGGKTPKPSKQELAAQQAQADMLNYQRDLLQRQQSQQEALAPLLYKQANLEPVYTDGKITGFNDLGPTEEQKAYTEQLAAQKEQLAAQLKNMKYGEALTPLQFQQQGYDVKFDDSGNPLSISVTPGGPADQQAQLTASQLKTANQQYEFNQMSLDRAKKAMSGELEIDPGIQRQFDENEATLRSQMQKNLGPGWETSTPGIEALANFQKRREEVVSAIQHGEISSAAGLALQGQQVNPQVANPFNTLGNANGVGVSMNPFAPQGGPNSRSAQLLSAVDAPFQGTGAFGTLAGQYGNQAALLQKYATPPGGNKAMGALGGAATGAAAGTMISPGYGTAIGAGVGALAGYFGT